MGDATRDPAATSTANKWLGLQSERLVAFVGRFVFTSTEPVAGIGCDALAALEIGGLPDQFVVALVKQFDTGRCSTPCRLEGWLRGRLLPRAWPGPWRQRPARRE